MKYKRILLKLSGEALQGTNKSINFDPNVLEQYTEEIKGVKEKGVELAIVIGGGNIFRGGQAEALGIDRVQGDYMGMLKWIGIVVGWAITTAVAFYGAINNGKGGP